MKTIYTSLPIYDRLSKQCFERGKHGGEDKPVPIICPRHKLPAFQWNAEADNMGAVSKIELIDTLGETYNAPCHFETWSNGSYDALTSSGLEISLAKTIGVHNQYAETAQYYIGKIGETVRVRGNLHIISGGTGFVPYINFYNLGALVNTQNLAEGANDLTYTLVDNSSAWPVTDGLQVSIFSASGSIEFSFTDVEITVDSINQYFSVLPATSVLATDTYYSWNGDTLNYLLPEGIYYLKITTANTFILYSDWFKVDCVYKNLITLWTNDGYNVTPVTIGTRIVSASETIAAAGGIISDSFSCIAGEEITIIFNLTKNSGQMPSIRFSDVADTDPQTSSLVAGLNIKTFTANFAGTYDIRIYNTAQTNFLTSEVMVNRYYSEKYLTIVFSNECDLGDILYSDGFTQTIWFESETMETSFPQEEQGMNNGEGRFVRSFARQVKKYMARTKEMPDFMAEVFNRMKLHDDIELTDLVGNVNDVFNLEVAHEWLGDDKYYAKFDLTFDYNEAFVIAGCCNNLV